MNSRNTWSIKSIKLNDIFGKFATWEIKVNVIKGNINISNIA